MKILNTKLARQAIAAALVLSAAAAMSVGAFAAEGEADTAALTEDVTVPGAGQRHDDRRDRRCADLGVGG